MSDDFQTEELLTGAEPRMLTIDEAAAYLTIPKATLYTWRTRRSGYGPPAVLCGSCLRYRREDLDAWIAAHLERSEELAANQREVDGISLARASHPRNR